MHLRVSLCRAAAITALTAAAFAGCRPSGEETTEVPRTTADGLTRDSSLSRGVDPRIPPRFDTLTAADGLASVAGSANPEPPTQRAPPAGRPRPLTQYVHRSWTEEDGLPYAGVTAITKTPDGYLWVGTKGGLARFDGERFVRFDTRNTAALQSHSISSLYAAPDGTLWIGTLAGLARYREGRFALLTTADGLPSDNVWAVTGGPDGTVWIGTLGGLARYRGGHLTRFTTADGLLTDDVRALSIAADGSVWVGTYGGGLNRWDGRRMRSVALAGSPSGALVRTVLAGRNGSAFVGVGEGQADRSPHQLLTVDAGVPRPLIPEQSLSAVRALIEEPDGALWAGTYGGGLARVVGGAAQLFTAQDGLTDDRVQAVYEGSDGALWVGTMGGLDLLRRDTPFATYGAAEGLPDDNVRAVMQDARGAVWVATANGLARLDADGVTAFRDGVPEAYVQSLWAGRGGAIWLGGMHGVTRYADGRFTRFGLPESWPHGAIWSIVEDRDGQLWLGSAGGGLVRFDPDGSTAYTEADGLVHNSVTALLPARAGGLWVGTASGLNRMVEGRVRTVAGGEHFAGINVRTLYEDGEGSLWAGTYGRGLLRLRDGRVDAFTVREGLHDDGVWSVLEDDRGWLWMSSDRGVFRVSKRDLEAVAAGERRLLRSVVYGVPDGMRSAEGNGAGKPAGWRTRDGRMWFATQGGVASVDPEATRRPGAAPLIEAVRAVPGGVRRDADGAVVLEPSARDFTVAYTRIDFVDPARLRFRYRLDGFTDGWITAGDRREAVFTNVPAGHYTFRVESAVGGEAWRTSDRALAISVAPFLWETGWFRVLAALGVVGLVGLAVRAQGRRQARRAAALEALVADRTEALRREKETTEAQAVRLFEADALKSAFFANVSHEFRTPLTLTLGPLDDLQAGLYGPLPTPMAEQVDLARRNAGRVLDLINQILDVARLEAGRTPLRARPLDLGAFVEALALPFRAHAARQSIRFQIDLPTTPTEVLADPAQLETALDNLLSNALKFTPEGGTVRVSVEAGEATAYVAVRDSGSGIPAADLPHVFDRFYQVGGAAPTQLGTGIGLSLAKEVVTLHGGTLAVESDEGFGSTFTLSLPLGRAHLAPEQLVEDAVPWTPDELMAARRAAAGGDGMANGEALVESSDDTDRTTVLVVEDHAEVRAYIRRHLDPAYRVLEAADGEEGLAAAREHLPDLVVSDVMMPKLDGLGLCRALKADPETDFIPVILLTAKAAPEDRLDGLHEHCDDYLTKPFDPAELRARIDNLIGVRQRLRERFRQEGIALVVWDDDATDGASPDGAVPDGSTPDPPADGPSGTASVPDPFLAQVLEAIEAHLGDEAFTVERLAETVGVSRGHLHRQLKSVAGQTPMDLIHTMRLEHAARLLSSQAGTVGEVAYAVGFKSVAHFSNRFSERFGCRPSAYIPDAPTV